MTELAPEDRVDDPIRTIGLLLLELDGASQKAGLRLARLAAILAASPEHALHSFQSQPAPLAAQGAHGNPLALTIREEPFFFAQLAEILPPLVRRNLAHQQRAQQRTPEDGPCLIVTTLHVSLRFRHVRACGVELNSGKAPSRCEAGEEPLREDLVPAVDQVQQTAPCGENVATFRAAVFLRRDGAHEAVQVVGGISLTQQRQTRLHGDGLRTEPCQQVPDGRPVQGT